MHADRNLFVTKPDDVFLFPLRVIPGRKQYTASVSGVFGIDNPVQ